MAEQLGTDGRWIKYGRGMRRYFKRSLAKERRRAERKGMENAPEQNRHLYAGYAD